MAQAPVHQNLLDPSGGAAPTSALPEGTQDLPTASPVLPGGGALTERGSLTVAEALGKPWDLLTFRAPRPVPSREATQASLARLGIPEAKPPVWRVAQPRWRKVRDPWPAWTGYDVHVLRRLSGRRVWHVALVVEDRLNAPVAPAGWVGWPSGDHFAEDWNPKVWQAQERARRDALRRAVAAEKEARLRLREASCALAMAQARQARAEATMAAIWARDPHGGDRASTCYSLTLGWQEDQIAEQLTTVLTSALRTELAALRFLLDPAGAPVVGAPAGPAAGPRPRGPALGRCSTCGRDLRDELSAARGFGPRCWEAHLLSQPERAGEVTPLSPRRLRRVLRALEA